MLFPEACRAAEAHGRGGNCSLKQSGYLFAASGPTPLPLPVQSHDFHRVRETNSFRICVYARVCVRRFFPFVHFAREMHTKRLSLFFDHSPSFSHYPAIFTQTLAFPLLALLVPSFFTSSLGQRTRQQTLLKCSVTVLTDLLVYTHADRQITQSDLLFS